MQLPCIQHTGSHASNESNEMYLSQDIHILYEKSKPPGSLVKCLVDHLSSKPIYKCSPLSECLPGCPSDYELNKQVNVLHMGAQSKETQ